VRIDVDDDLPDEAWKRLEAWDLPEAEHGLYYWDRNRDEWRGA
jgi:hypothetical protein